MASLLLSGIGMHQHEYSHETVKSVRRKSPLTRAAFSAPIPKSITTYEKQDTVTHSFRPLSGDIHRSIENIPVVHFEQREETDTMSDGGRSISEASGISAVGSAGSNAGRDRRRRKSSRAGSTFRLAQPAPTLSAKQRLLQIRPKLLLQLQRLSVDSRPVPAIDVLPSTQVVPRLIKKFPRMFRGKGELGANDVMVVKSEAYDINHAFGSEEHDSDEDNLSGRELMAVICQMPKDLGGLQGKAELVLKDGTVWIATPEENGRYFQFVTTDKDGYKTTARWVKDKKLTRRSTGGLEPANQFPNTEFKFKFSIINPNTRQHPFMATITNTTLDIPDHYTTPASAIPSSPPDSIPPTPGSLECKREEEQTLRSTVTIDDNLRTLIQVTGIWVALRQGLSSYFKYSDLQACSPRPSVCGRASSFSATLDPKYLGSPDHVSLTPESGHSSSLTGFGGKIRARVCPASPTIPQFEHRPVPKRTISAGATFMQRTAGHRVANIPTTVISESEGEKSETLPLNSKLIDANISDPPSNQASSPSKTTPDTLPQFPPRRGQSINLQDASHHEAIGLGIKRYNEEEHLHSDYGKTLRRKTGRWKTITNFIRRKSESSNAH